MRTPTLLENLSSTVWTDVHVELLSKCPATVLDLLVGFTADTFVIWLLAFGTRVSVALLTVT